MKNTKIRIIALIIAVSAIITVAGCGDKGSSTKPDENGKITVGNSDSQYEVDADTITTPQENNFLESFKTTTAKSGDKTNANSNNVNQGIIDDFIKEKAPVYGLPDEEVKNIVEKPDEWISFDYAVIIENKDSKKVMQAYYLTVEKNGENGVWLANTLDADYGIPSKTSRVVYLSGFAKKSVEEQLDKILSEMKVEMHYVLIDNVNVEVNWKEDTTKKMKIN